MALRRTGAGTANDGIGRRVHRARLTSVLLALVSATACSGGDSATGNGVHLAIRTDIAVPDGMSAVSVAVTGSGAGLAAFTAANTIPGLTAADLPLSVGVGPDVPTSTWQVDLPPGYEWVVFRVSGVLSDRVVVERWQVARMDGTLHQVAVDLQTACLAMPCAIGEECVAGVCRAAPRPEGWTSTCGDGVPDAPEECDGGEVFNSDTRRDACRTDCHLPGCGDDVIDTGEQCDDGNTTPGDGCSSTCQTEAGG